MSKTILLDDIGAFTQAAWIEDGSLIDYQIEAKALQSRIGDVYLGKVERVVESLRAAYVDIGASQSAFLPLAAGASAGKRTIDSVFTGQKLYVQLKRFATPTKAARLSTDITLPGSALIYCPIGAGVTVSKRIADRTRKRALREQMQSWLEQNGVSGSFIVRARAVDLSAPALFAEALELSAQWHASRVNRAGASKPQRILSAPSLVERVVQASKADSITCVLATLHASNWLKAQALTESPYWQVYAQATPLFTRWGVDELIRSLTLREVALPSGGGIVFDQSEALTVIDVNSGSASQDNAPDTAMNTNLEACVSLAEQLRLRNLGGLCVIDFINLESEQQQDRIISALAAALQPDALVQPTSGFSQSGIVELRRSRRGSSLSQMLREPCPSCLGAGQVDAPLFIAHQIVQELVASARKYRANAYTIKVGSAVLAVLNTVLATELASVRAEFECELTLSEQAHNAKADYAIILGH